MRDEKARAPEKSEELPQEAFKVLLCGVRMTKRALREGVPTPVTVTADGRLQVRAKMSRRSVKV